MAAGLDAGVEVVAAAGLADLGVVAGLLARNKCD